MKIILWRKLSSDESYNIQRSDDLWRFACGDVLPNVWSIFDQQPIYSRVNLKDSWTVAGPFSLHPQWHWQRCSILPWKTHEHPAEYIHIDKSTPLKVKIIERKNIYFLLKFLRKLQILVMLKLTRINSERKCYAQDALDALDVLDALE